MVNLAQIRADLEAALPPVIERTKIAHYLGGMYKASTMSVYDSQGIGIKDPLRMEGNKVGYLKENLIEWFLSKIKAEEDEKHPRY